MVSPNNKSRLSSSMSLEAGSVSARQRTWHVVGSVFWALIPLLSFGALAVVPALHAALKLRRSHLWLFVVAYLSVTIFVFVAIPPPQVSDPGVMGDLAGAAVLVLIAGGTVHAFMLRPHVFGGTLRRPDSFIPDAPAATQTNRPQSQIQTVGDAPASRNFQRHAITDPDLGVNKPERLSKYEILILVVTVVVGLLSAVSTIVAAALSK